MPYPLIEFIGSLAAVLTTVSFVPQVWRAWRTRSTADLSPLMLIAFATGVSLWLIYGLTLGIFPLIAANAITLSLIGVLIWLKFFARPRTMVPPV